MSNLFVSFMRTLVPLVAGVVLGWAARLGLDLDDAQVAAYVTAGLSAGYYALFRFLEEASERMAWEPLRLVAGVLLGWARPPQYVKPVTAPVRLKLDRAAMDQDITDFVRRLNAAAEERGPR